MPTQLKMVGPAAYASPVDNVFEIDANRIRVHAGQVRQTGKELDSMEMQQLAASINDQGLIQYPEVRWIAEEDNLRADLW